MTHSEIHWFSIVNSMVIVLFLSGFVAVIMIRTLRQDLSKYNTPEDQEEETGWKLVHADVFRPPAYGEIFAVLVGSGVQVILMTLLTVAFALLGFLSPANRGGLVTAFLFCFVLMGIPAGYWSTRMYTMFKLPAWRWNAMLTATFFPGVTFTMFFILNLFIWGEKSSGAVPMTTLLALLILWFGISAPLVFVGSHFAMRYPPIQPCVKVNALPRVILQTDSMYSSPVLAILIGGMLPFAAAFIEIYFIMSSMWLHQFYYVFGFLFIVLLILMVTCAEIAIIMCYFRLCQEDYRWWWQSFLTSGSSALYLFGYSTVYFFTKLQIQSFVPAILFFGYMFLISFAFFLVTGTIGTTSCYFFVRKIYSSIKIE